MNEMDVILCNMVCSNTQKAAAEMAPTLAELAKDNELVLTHGNGPQVGGKSMIDVIFCKTIRTSWIRF